MPFEWEIGHQCCIQHFFLCFFSFSLITLFIHILDYGKQKKTIALQINSININAWSNRLWCVLFIQTMSNFIVYNTFAFHFIAFDSFNSFFWIMDTHFVSAYSDLRIQCTHYNIGWIFKFNFKIIIVFYNLTILSMSNLGLVCVNQYHGCENF